MDAVSAAVSLIPDLMIPADVDFVLVVNVWRWSVCWWQ